jgi:hypothetical protein
MQSVDGGGEFLCLVKIVASSTSSVAKNRRSRKGATIIRNITV